jgi:hypothetical protein
MTNLSAASCRYTRADERIDAPRQPVDIDPTPLFGRWENTNPQTDGIAGVSVTRDGAGVTVVVREASGADPRRAIVDGLYASAVTGTTASAFTADFEVAGHQTRLEANLSLGLLVIAACQVFPDGDPRANSFRREFFYFAGDRP